MIERSGWFRAALVSTGLAGVIACQPPKGLGEGPPTIDERTPTLATFVPAALAEPGASGLDLAAIAGEEPPAPPTPIPLPPPAMIEYSPVGETGEYANIEFRFNRPVVPLGERERLDPAALGLKIEPAIEGELYFAEPTRLVFAPKEALPPAAIFVVRLDARLQAVEGPAFDADASFVFMTPPPSVSLWPDDEGRMQGETFHWDTSVRIQGGGDFRLADLTKHLHAEALDEQGNATPVAVTVRKAKKNPWGYDDAEFVVSPTTHWPAGREVVVRVDGELRGRRGPRPTGHEEAVSFAVAEGVEVNEVTCYQDTYADGCEIGPVLVSFTAPVRRANAKYVSVSPDSRGFDTLAFDRLYDYDRSKARDAYWSVLAWGDYSLGGEYRVTIDPRVRDIHGQRFVGTDEFEVRFAEPPPSLALASARGTLVLAKSPRVGIETRHVETLRVRAAVLDDATLEQLLDQSIEGRAWPSAGVHDEKLPLAPLGQHGWSSIELDLGKYTGSRPGAVLFEIAADSLVTAAAQRNLPALSAQRGLVQLTNLGVSLVGSLPGGAVRVADLSTDKPIVGAEIELVLEPGGERRVLGKTDAEGLLALPSASEVSSRAQLRARKGDDAVLVAIGSIARSESPVAGLRVGESVRAAITSERKLYKPGESIRLIGWASVASPYELSGLRRLPAKTSVTIELRNPKGELVATRSVRAKPHGKFWATIPVPEQGALGDYVVTASLLAGTYTTSVQVKDFVAPEFEVTAEAASTDIHHGETTSVGVNARYYFGGPVKVTRARETIECGQADFRPAGLAPEWSIAPRRDNWWGRAGTAPTRLRLPASAERGHLETTLQPRGVDPHRPARCTYAIALADATEREVGAETSAWVHPAFYVAAKLPGMVETKQSIEIPVSTIDFDGSPIAVDEVRVTLTRRWSEPEWVKQGGEKVFAGWRERTKQLPVCKTNTRSGPTSCSFTTLEHGSYDVLVEAERGDYQPSLAGWFWVPDPDQPRWTWSSTPVASLAVELDKKDPKPGERVRARVRAPWASGKGVLMLAKGGVHELRRFTLEQGAAELEFTATDAWIPHAELWAMMIQPGNATNHPRLVTASASVDVGNASRRLQVTLDVASEARTGDTLPIVVHARDDHDQPVRGHVSVWAVDEAVLALAPLELPNFVETFTVNLGAGLGFASSYGALLFPYVARGDWYSPMRFDPNWTRDPSSMLGYGFGHGSGGGFGGRSSHGGVGVGTVGGEPMPARSKFSAAPIFIGDAELDAQGVAKLSGELPDNLTTFRVTAVVSSPIPDHDVEARFGSSDARVRVTRPVIVRSALPRILRPGDTAEIGVLVDNLRAGAGELELEVALHDAEGKLELVTAPRARLSVAAGEQVRVPFEVRALATGTVRFEARATVRPREGKPESDALILPLPIEPERTLTDRVAVYGTLDADGAALLPFELPDAIDPAFGGLSVSIGSSMLGGVEDAVAYLVDYPYGCLEQTSSSLLPLIPLGRLAAEYPLGITDTTQYVEAGVQRLASMQLPSGGFAYWPGGTEPNRYASAYATWVLGQAIRAGYAVPDTMYQAALGYLATEIEAWKVQTAPSRARDIEIVLALAALADIQAAPSDALTKMYERRAGMPAFTKAMLALAFERQSQGDTQANAPAKQLLAELRGFIDEREASARVEQADALWTGYWDSSVRSSAIVLMAMLAIEPEHVLVAKLARGLLDARQGGRWSNTQENAYALLALADYAAVYEAEVPDFEGRVWLDRSALVRVAVEGRSFEFEDSFTDMGKLLAADRQDPSSSALLLERAGVGRMYYRVGLEWASTARDLPARSEGLTITRALRDPQGTIADDQVIATGELLALDVTLDTRSELTHVAIELPLPAGLEAIDLELGKGSSAMKIAGRRGHWVSHQELRRDRAVVFADHLDPGTHHTTVFLRATTPGEYEMPPASAEMMYYPEVYGRTASRRVSVR